MIRRADSGDIEGLVGVHRESAEHHVGLDAGLYRIPVAESVAGVFREALGRADAAVFVAEVEGVVAGFAQVQRNPAGGDSMVRPRVTADLDIAVLEGFRGRGLGRELMAVVEGWCAENGVEYLVFTCHAANESALRFYDELGCRRIGYVIEKRILGQD